MSESGITPVGHRVLVLPEETERKTKSGIILQDKTVMMEESAQTQGTVIAIGDTCWEDEQAPWAEVGDFVMFGKYAGVVYEGNDGKKYRVLNDRDIVAILTKKEENDE